MQVLAGGTIGFDSGLQPGPGADNSAGGGNNYTGGKWYMTVNGQQFPTIPITVPDAGSCQLLVVFWFAR